MRVLVVYASQFGSTKEIAERVAGVLEGSGLTVHLVAAGERPSAEDYDAFVVGSAVHGGRWLQAATEFVTLNRGVLAGRPVWLFSSGPIGDLPVRSPQPDPKEVGEFGRWLGPRDHRIFAGSFDRATADFSTLGIVERTVVRRFLPDGDWRDWPSIEGWAEGIARALGARPHRRAAAEAPLAAG